MSNAVATTLTFENTSRWELQYFSLADQPLTTIVRMSDISLPPPPANDSLETRADIGAMLRMKAERTPATVAAIQSEAGTTTARFIDHTFVEYLQTSSTLPEAPPLLYAWQDLSILIMTEKKKFNRPRPHVLKASIDPIIEVPRHPAYPSGHSTQAHFLAYVLSELHSESHDANFRRADEIAHHREVAGLHYPSDSAAGAILAKQYFDALHTDPTFLALMKEAKEKIAKQ
jgi:acid phosphatase (class A)